MRTYPSNSPQAAARIVALALLADGHLAKSELDALESLGAHRQLGLKPAELHEVIRALCEDLLSTADRNWEAACRIDRHTLAMLMAEIEDPGLRATVLELCAAAIAADARVAEGEALVLSVALEHWRQSCEPKQSQRAEARMANA